MIYPFRELTEEEQIYNLNKSVNINRGTLTTIDIADIHFGVIDPKTQYDILMEQFVNRISLLNFNAICINGDIFEHKFMSNDPAVYYAILFIDNLVHLCKLKGATLLIIGGTESHDADQIKLFHKYLYDETVDVRIVENNARFEYIAGAKILCIPEMYNRGKEYYDFFLEQPYDTVRMHGSIKGAIFGNDKDDLDSRAPTFRIEDFNRCNGPIISGHVHKAGCFEKYMYYSGTPIRAKFGEEEEKGFFITLHNLDNHSHYVHFERIESFRYDTINLDDVIMQDPSITIQYINQLQQQGIHNIKIKFTKEPDEVTNANIEVIKNYFRNNRTVHVESKNIRREQLNKNTKEFLDKYEQYSYIIDKSLSEYDILSRYINEQMGYTYITSDDLKSFIQEEF